VGAADVNHGPRGLDRLGRRRFFGAGDAHAGALLVLSLAYLLYMPRADFPTDWNGSPGVLIAGVLGQSGGFFVQLGVGREGRPSGGTKLTRAGAALIGAASSRSSRGAADDREPPKGA
jgi:hypothetical protein